MLASTPTFPYRLPMYLGQEIETINLLEASQFVQDRVSETSTAEEATEVWNDHRPLLGSNPAYAGARSLHIRTELALMIRDGLSSEEAVYPYLRYGELALKGRLANVNMLHLNGRPLVVWMITDAVLRDIHLEEIEITNDTEDREFVNPLPVGRPIRRPLYAPAKMIDSVLCAE